jgi:sulfonate transport system ATP-binding protein
MSLLEIEVDDKRYGNRTVLRGLRVGLQHREIVSLLGASGCGKSTLLAIAAGLDREARASVRLGGKPLAGPDAGIGFVFQEPRLFPWLTVAQNIAFGAGVREAGAIQALLAEVGLSGLADALPKHCPAARHSGWRSPAACSRGRACCCSMNRSRRSMRSRA